MGGTQAYLYSDIATVCKDKEECDYDTEEVKWAF